jgi:hypothetical protein
MMSMLGRGIGICFGTLGALVHDRSGTLLAFASISTDLYLPAMPSMSVALAATQATLQYTVSGYLIGFSAGSCSLGR